MGTKIDLVKKRLDSLEWELKQLRILIDNLDSEDVINNIPLENITPAIVNDDYDSV